MIISKRRKRKLDKNSSCNFKRQRATLGYECVKLKKEKELIERLYQQHISFYDLAPTGYITISRDGRIIYANQSTFSFFKIDIHSLVGMYLSDFIEEYSLKVFKDFLNEMINSLEKKSCYLAVKNANSISFNVEFEGTFLEGRDEFLINLVDIRGRIKILDQLSDNERRYQDILYNLNEGIAIVDLNESFIYSNKSGDEIFDVSGSGLMNHNLKEFLSQNQIDIFLAQSKKRDEGLRSKYDLEIVTLEGKQKLLKVSGEPYLNRKGERIGTLASFSDITQQKNNEIEIQRRLKLELIISEISNDFIHLKEEYLDRSVNRALAKIGNFAEVDRSYIFLFTEDELFCNNSHEWCNEGIEPQIENLQEIPVSLLPWWMDKLNKYETIHIPLVSDLPPEAHSEKEILEAQDVKSLLVIPLVNSDGLIGFLGFDSVAQVKMWQQEDILLLTMLGEIIGSGFGRLRSEEQLIQLNTYLEQKVEEKTKDVINLLELNRAIVNNVGLIVISTDPSGIIRSINPFAEKILGYSSSEVVGLSTPLIFHDSSDVLCKIKKHFTKEEQDRYSQFELLTRIGLNEGNFDDRNEWDFISKNGQKINVLLTVSKLNNEEGETIGFVGVAIDITSKKIAEEQLQKSENENNAIINAVPDIFFKLNREGIYLDYKNNGTQALLANPDVFIGNSIHNILPADLAKKSMDALEEAFDTGKIVQYDYSLEINNKLNFYENRIITTSDNVAISIIRDITERKLVEESLKNTTQNLTILIQNLQSGILFENTARKIYMVNQSFCDLFGIDLSPESLVGFDCVIASESSKQLMLEPDLFIERINEILIEKKNINNDELKLKDGRIFERDYIPVFDNNNLIGHLWQYRDVTEKKQIERYAILQRELGFNLAATSTIEQALNLVIQAALRIEGIQAAGIYYIQHPKEELELIVHQGFSPEFVNKVMSYDKKQFHYQLVQKGEPVYGFYNEVIPNSTLFAAENLKQIGIVPIKYEGRIIGSVNVASSSGERFKYSVQLSLEMISAQIGGTLARIEMENELKLSQRNFQQMFETIDDFMFILDVEGRIIKTNPIVERRLGYTKEELIGMSVLQVHPPTRRDEAAVIVGEMLAGRLDVCPVPLCKKNGELVPVETKVVIGKWDGKDALYGISRDISELLKAEETLRESEARWHFALEGSGDGVWDWNIKTSEVYFSTQWKTMLGYSESEIGNTIDDCINLVHPDDLPKRINELDRHFNGETKIYENEHRKRCKDGSYKWVLDRGKVLVMTSDEKPLRIIGTQTDITSQKVLEEQLRISINKERELNDLKSRFVATTSHEFRTPLASILMISDTLLLFQHKMDSQQISKRLAKIKDHVNLLTEIVNDVLQLSKLQEGKIGYTPKEEDIVLLCKNIIDGFNETIYAENVIEFKSQVNTLEVLIDSKLIIQAINNLISNAIKYSNQQPKITVKLRVNKEEMIISVKDNGIGIPEEDQKHLFNPFFRAGNVSTIQGNGLGLSIVLESMKMHGGKVSFISVMGTGTIFTLHFPLSVLIESRS